MKSLKFWIDTYFWKWCTCTSRWSVGIYLNKVCRVYLYCRRKKLQILFLQMRISHLPCATHCLICKRFWFSFDFFGFRMNIWKKKRGVLWIFAGCFFIDFKTAVDPNCRRWLWNNFVQFESLLLSCWYWTFCNLFSFFFFCYFILFHFFYFLFFIFFAYRFCTILVLGFEKAKRGRKKRKTGGWEKEKEGFLCLLKWWDVSGAAKEKELRSSICCRSNESR